MKTIEEIVCKYSHDTPDGLEIDFRNINKMMDELKANSKELTLHMLEYCFNNVGNKDVNVEREIDKYLNPPKDEN